MLGSFFYRGRFSYTSREVSSFFIKGFSLTHPVLASFFCGEFFLHIMCCLLFLSREFLLHIPWWLYLSVGSFFICRIFLTRPRGAGFSRRGCLNQAAHSFLTSSFCLPALSTIFHSKNYFHNTSVFSSHLTAYFYLTGHSPVFIHNTALLYIILLTLCGHLQTQRVCRALHPVSGEDGILVDEVPRGVQHASSARTSPRRVVGLARPNQSAGRALP